MNSRTEPNDRASIDAEIARVMAEHLAATTRPALHVGRCSRPDLDEQLIALYARKRSIAEAKS